MDFRTSLAISLVALSLTVGGLDQRARASSPATGNSRIAVTLVETRGRTPPLRSSYVTLSITNRADRPVWYVLPYFGDEPLPTRDAFRTRSPWKTSSVVAHATNGERYGGKGTFRTVAILGAERPVSHSFVALLLSARGHLQHDFFAIDSWSEITELEVWEVSALKVNGTTPLEDWLPFVVMTDDDTHITRDAAVSTDRDAFRWKPGRSANDFPAGEVTTIVPTGVTKHRMPIQ